MRTPKSKTQQRKDITSIYLVAPTKLIYSGTLKNKWYLSFILTIGDISQMQNFLNQRMKISLSKKILHQSIRSCSYFMYYIMYYITKWTYIMVSKQYFCCSAFFDMHSKNNFTPTRSENEISFRMGRIRSESFDWHTYKQHFSSDWAFITIVCV